MCKYLRVIFAALFCLTGTDSTKAQSTAFTYQGRLSDGGRPVSGVFDLTFTLHGNATNPAPIGTYVLLTAVPVTNGLFTVRLNENDEFDRNAFTGPPRWLEIGVRSNGVLGNFTVLSPRQSLDATPYAAFAFNAAIANTVPDGAITTAKLAPGAVTAAQIAPGSITATQLAPGAAAANLGPENFGGVPAGTIVMSDREVNVALTNAGFVPVGASFGSTGEVWTTLAPGPPATGALDPGRYGHKAVWTGTEMIFIGGTPDNSGLRYNPSGNSWIVMNKSNAPAIGEEVHAFWSGTQLLVWDAYHRVGGRYTPGTDSWTPVSDTNAPSARAGSSAAFANGYLVVWGGADLDQDQQLFNTGGRYNPANNTWTATSLANPPFRRAEATATAIGTDIIFYGGRTTNYYYVSNVFSGIETAYGFAEMASGSRYNPAANTWTDIADSPVGRYRHSATWSGTYLLVWGGVNLVFEQSSIADPYVLTAQPLASGAKYDPVADTWTALPTNGRPNVVVDHTAVWSSTGSLMIWGGAIGRRSCFLGGCDFEETPTNSGVRYVQASDTWVPLASTTLDDRQAHAAVWSGSQMIVWGGKNRFDDAFGDGMRYNLAANTWASMSPPPASGEPSERQRATAVWAGDALIVWGGSAGNVPLRTGGIFRQATGWTNTPLSGAPSPRFAHTAVWTGTEMLIWGGLGGFSSVPVNTGARFNVSSNRWFSTSTVGAPRARAFHTAVWTGTEMIIYGGYDFTNLFAPTFLNSLGRYNPATDTWSTNVVAFGAGRASATAIWTGTEMITWGGYSSAGLFSPITYYSSGGRYNPVSNAWISLPASGLSGRNNHTAVWSGNEMLIWGGRGTSGPTNTGAIYNRASGTWRPISTTNALNERYNHTAVWADPPGQMFVWGGENGTTSSGLGALYDPYTARWTAITNTGPLAGRSLHTATWTGKETLIFDGVTSAQVELNTGAAYRARKIYWLYQKP